MVVNAFNFGTEEDCNFKASQSHLVQTNFGLLDYFTKGRKCMSCMCCYNLEDFSYKQIASLDLNKLHTKHILDVF